MSSRTKSKQPAKKASGGLNFSNVIGLVVVLLVCALALWGLFGGQDGESDARPVPATRTPRPVVSSPAPATTSPVVSTSQAPTRQGAPWEYDAATNHHYDPRPGHQHWHAGPPPPEDQRDIGSPTITQVTPGASPIQVNPGDGVNSSVTPIQVNPVADGRPQRSGSPWEYDAESDFHWDPRPGHQHWHKGQPPPEDQRQ